MLGQGYCYVHASQESATNEVTSSENGTNGTAKKRERFLGQLEVLKSVSSACAAIDIGRTTVYRWKKEDQAFADAWDEIENQFLSDLQESALDRAIHGAVIEKKFDDEGNVIGEKRAFETALTIFLLKTRLPKVYNRKALDPEVDQERRGRRRFRMVRDDGDR